MTLEVSEVLVACDAVECGYRIVELADSRFAFLWGNMRCQVGDTLPQDQVDAPTCDKGVEVFTTYALAEAAYRQCARAMESMNSRAGGEMLAAL